MTPRPGPTPPPTRPRPATPPAPARIPWGWLEWSLVGQTFLPAFLFIPGITAIRTPIRVSSFLIAIIAWYLVLSRGKRRAGALSFTAGFWLKLASGWLILSLFNPNVVSHLAGLAQVVVYISVLSPAFWAPSALVSSRQINRLMTILLVCNGLSAMVGVAQVFRPNIFNPPVMPLLVAAGSGSESAQGAMTYEDEFGNRIIRPCGLTDSPGAASSAGGVAAMIGLACALRSVGLIRRGLSLLLAFFGLAAIYYSQVRVILVMLLICMVVLIGLFILQRDFKKAVLLGGLSFGVIVGALVWVVSQSGIIVVQRFANLIEKSASENYKVSSRGDFIREAFERTLMDYPLGAGPGRWGTMYGAFDGQHPNDVLWVEVMIPAWIVDGGLPLLLFYVGAIVFAMVDTFRIALWGPDENIRFWGAVVFASNLSVIASCFSYVSFVTPFGIQFWLLSAALHAADLRAKREQTAAASAPARAAGKRPANRLGPGPEPAAS